WGRNGECHRRRRHSHGQERIGGGPRDRSGDGVRSGARLGSARRSPRRSLVKFRNATGVLISAPTGLPFRRSSLTARPSISLGVAVPGFRNPVDVAEYALGVLKRCLKCKL